MSYCLYKVQTPMRSLLDIKTQGRQYSHNRYMSGPGYRKWYQKIIEQGVEGHYASSNKALTLRHVGLGQGACVPWVAEAITLGQGQQPHPFTGCTAPPGRRALRVRFSGVVSAKPLGER